MINGLQLESINLAIMELEDSSRAFQEGTYLSSSLYYDGEIPILSLDMSDPFLAGKAHGYLCGSAIHEITKSVNATLEKPPEAVRSQILDKVRNEISYDLESYLLELDGILAGYLEWVDEQPEEGISPQLTKDDLLLCQILPDYFGLTNIRRAHVACTTIVEKEGPHGSVFVRNLDHDSFGTLGTYSLIIQRNNTVSIGMPCLVGILTGMNSAGLVLAMNTCTDAYVKKIQGLPAAIFCRQALEVNATVQELFQFAMRNRPMVAFHLTSADRTGNGVAHEFFGLKQARGMEDGHLVTLNGHYDCIGAPINEEENDRLRFEAIQQFFQMREGRPLQEVLESAPVNRPDTIHRIVVNLSTQELFVAFANSLAGSRPLQKVHLR